MTKFTFETCAGTIHIEADRGGGRIESDCQYDDNGSEFIDVNAGVAAIESFLVTLAVEGVDIGTPAFRRAIENCLFHIKILS